MQIASDPGTLVASERLPPGGGELDLVRSMHEAWQRGDFSSADWAHSEIEYVHVDGPAPEDERAGDARAASRG